MNHYRLVSRRKYTTTTRENYVGHRPINVCIVMYVNFRRIALFDTGAVELYGPGVLNGVVHSLLDNTTARR